jgi:GrpB-like predicted nucleotidyltransferase (UPF0157 family)
MRTTILMPWTADWMKQYTVEEQRLTAILSSDLLSIHHIGSTSVPAIGVAKPIIDILAVVKRLDRVAIYTDDLEAAHYVARGENGIPGRRYFIKGGDDRTHHLHMYEAGDIHIAQHLNFKNYVLHHPQAAHEYGQLKLQLAHLLPEQPAAYAAGKADFCARLVEQAMEWASRHTDQ